MRRPPFLLALVAAAPLAALGCGPAARGGEKAPATTPTDPEHAGRTEYPLAIEVTPGQRLVVPAPPRRILPCNTGAVDLISELVDPSRVVGLPETVAAYASLGGEAWKRVPIVDDLTSEVALELDPDLVLTHSWQDPAAMEVLRVAGVNVLELPEPHSYEEARELLFMLGEIFDTTDRARRIVADTDRRVAALRRDHSRDGLTAMTYSNWGTGGWTAGAETNADVILELAGLENAAAAAGITGHDRIDFEQLLVIDPDYLVISYSTVASKPSPTLELLRSEPALADLTAVRESHFVLLDPRLSTTNSHRMVEAAEALAAAVDELRRSDRSSDTGPRRQPEARPPASGSPPGPPGGRSGGR